MLGQFTRSLGVWSYGIINLIHILGIVMLFGSILLLDLRLLGAWRSIPLAALSRPTTTLAMTGFAVAVASGIPMLAVMAGDYAGNPFLLIKFPAIALALPQASILVRVMRSSLLDTLDEDYIRTVRAKGLSRQTALWRHALRNALIPVLTIVGLQFSFLLAGGIIIENVFFLPGLGRLVFQSISARDLIVVKSVVMLLVFAVIFVNFLVDVSYAFVDPRLRRQR